MIGLDANKLKALERIAAALETAPIPLSVVIE